MKIFKKVMCLVLSFVMLLSCVAVSASALADGKTLGYILVPDKTTVNPGDVVTYSLYIDTDPSIAYANIALIFSYNSSVFVTPTKTTLNRTFYGDFAGYYKEASLVNVAATVHNAIKANLTPEEAAAYNASFIIQGTCDTGLGTLADGFTITSADTLQMTFQMTVADSVAPGTAVSVAITEGAVKTTSRCSFKQVTGSSTTGGTAVAAANIDVSTAVATASVAAAAPELTVENNKNQIRYGKNSRGEYAGQVDIRNVAKIAATEFEAIDVSSITEAGFVYAPSTTAFSAETAQAVAKGTAADGYAKATVGTIYDEGDYYTFSCLVYGIDDADIATAAYNCYAYIAVDGEYWFFYADAVAISALSLYNTHLANANTAYGWTLAAK